MPTIPELLTESEKNIKDLVAEIQTFKSSRVLNERAVESLGTVATALSKTNEAIKPFKSTIIKKYLIVLSSITIINLLLLIAILLKLMLVW